MGPFLFSLLLSVRAALSSLLSGILARVSLIAIVAVVLGALIVIFFVGGLFAARRQRVASEERLRERITHADRALEAARASDRGWDRAVLETATREALERERPDFRYETLHLVLVDDRPGTEEDRALMGAIGDEGELRIMLIRRGNIWEGQLIA